MVNLFERYRNRRVHVIRASVVLFPHCSQVNIFSAVMATQLDLPLPEVTVDNFRRDWTRFELVADGGSATLNFRRRDSESAVIFCDSMIPSEILYDS